MRDQIVRLLTPLRTRIANMVARAVVQLAKDDGKTLQLVQLRLLDDVVRGSCERFQEYGFTSVPHAGAEAVVMFVGGKGDHPVVVAIDDRRHRKKGMAAGEVALYTEEGDYVLLQRGRVVEVKAGTKLRVEAPEAEFTGVVNTDSHFEVAGTQVVGEQQPTILPPAGGGTVDTQARAAIGSLITTLRTHGLIA